MRKKSLRKLRRQTTARSSALSVGALVASAAIGSGMVWPAWAQDAPGSMAATASATSGLTLRRYDIPAGPLGGALEAYGKAAKVRVKFQSLAVRNLQSPGASGLFTDEQALQLLLGGTGVTYHFTDASTVSVAQSVVPSALVKNSSGAITLPTLSVKGAQVETDNSYNPQNSLFKSTRNRWSILHSL